jgi:hypothetical protein
VADPFGASSAGRAAAELRLPGQRSRFRGGYAASCQLAPGPDVHTVLSDDGGGKLGRESILNR